MPFKVASKKFPLIQHWIKKIIVSTKKGTELGSEQCNTRQKKGSNSSEGMKEMSKQSEASETNSCIAKDCLRWYQCSMGGGFSSLVRLKSYNLRYLRKDKAWYFPILVKNKWSQHDVSVLKSHWNPQITWEAQGMGVRPGPSDFLPDGLVFHFLSSLQSSAAFPVLRLLLSLQKLSLPFLLSSMGFSTSDNC